MRLSNMILNGLLTYKESIIINPNHPFLQNKFNIVLAYVCNSLNLTVLGRKK